MAHLVVVAHGDPADLLMPLHQGLKSLLILQEFVCVVELALVHAVRPIDVDASAVVTLLRSVARQTEGLG